VQTLAIIVNYKVAALTVEAARSVLESESLFPCRVVVVDNSEDAREESLLRFALPRGVDLVVPPDNLGFGQACNLVMENFSGDFILLLNPDARLLPGCLQRLQHVLLQEKKVAAAGPQVYWDDHCNYYLPPPSTPFMFLYAPVATKAPPGSWIKKYLGLFWRRHAIKTWRSEAPMEVRNLSGGHVLLKREALERAGGLFDPRFFLYFEDTDLFMRLRKAGYSLVFDAGARVVHHYDQSAQHDTEKKRQLFMESHEKFLEKHLTGGKLWIHKILGGLFLLCRENSDWEKIPVFTAPFRLEVPASVRKNWLFEWSPAPDFIPAAGMFGRGEYVDFSAEYWDMLAPGRYYGRLGGLSGKSLDRCRVCWDVREKVVMKERKMDE